MTDMPRLIDEFERALLSLDRLEAQRALEAVDSDIGALHLVEQIVVPALERIGHSWEQGRLALSQVYMSGRICEDLIVERLPPSGSPRQTQPRMAIAALIDHHVLGKRMVCSALRAGGYAVTDYGSVGVDDLIARVCSDCIEMVLISTLMLPSAMRVSEVRAGLQARGSRAGIVVGGAPFRLDDRLWREVGADAMGRTAADAVRIVADWKVGRWRPTVLPRCNVS